MHSNMVTSPYGLVASKNLMKPSRIRAGAINANTTKSKPSRQTMRKIIRTRILALRSEAITLT